MFTLASLILSRTVRRSAGYSFDARNSNYATTSTYGTGETYFEPLSPKLLKAIADCIPELTFDKHKGQCGRIGVLGGSEEYTGAPHYASISALKCGADLSTIITEPSAATPIKSYSPEHIVLPYLQAVDGVERITPCLSRFHSVVVGPGLGRDDKQLQVAEKIIEKIIELELPMVIDADGLFLVTQKPQLIQGYPKVVLTPNAAEFGRLYTAVLNRPPTEGEPIMDVKRLAGKLQVTILRKGKTDIVSDGSISLVINTETRPRRCGGQGDLLAGVLAIFSHWTHQAQPDMMEQNHMKLYGPNMLATVGACAIARECNRRAVDKHGRSTLVPQMIAEIGGVFADIFETDFAPTSSF